MLGVYAFRHHHPPSNPFTSIDYITYMKKYNMDIYEKPPSLCHPFPPLRCLTNIPWMYMYVDI